MLVIVAHDTHDSICSLRQCSARAQLISSCRGGRCAEETSMELTAHPLINAGFALSLAAAGVIAAPVVAPLPGLPAIQTRDVQLVDVSWDQVLQTALANATDIYDHFSPAPFADLQQV